MCIKHTVSKRKDSLFPLKCLQRLCVRSDAMEEMNDEVSKFALLMSNDHTRGYIYKLSEGCS